MSPRLSRTRNWTRIGPRVAPPLRAAALRTPRTPVGEDVHAHPAVVQLTGVYHNLLRQWAEI